MTRILSIILIMLMFMTSCSKPELTEGYQTENAGGTGYGASVKSALYIDDFYFLTVGTQKSVIDLIIGSAHYCRDNNELMPVYTLNNGDKIAITFDEQKSTVLTAEYTYSDGEKESFFDILVDIGVLASSTQETTDTTVQLPSGDTNSTGDDNTVEIPDNIDDIPVIPDNPNNTETEEKHTAVQGEVFATGMYNLTLIEAVLEIGMPRSSILAVVGKPNYYFSTTFTNDSYIIDCYNLNDGSKLYLDYGYGRDNLRCAAVYKNGTYTSILSSSWTAQSKPEGFTRTTVDSSRIKSLKKNLTPAKVYASFGEPSWYEGNRGSYNDVYALNDGSYAYLNFGSAHNKLTSVSIKGADGTVTVITLD